MRRRGTADKRNGILNYKDIGLELSARASIPRTVLRVAGGGGGHHSQIVGTEKEGAGPPDYQIA